MKTFLAVLVSCTWLFSCQPAQEEENVPELINQIMQSEAEAWNRGDLNGFMEGYWRNDSLVFIGSRGLTYGYNHVLNNYKQTYPSRSAMGTLQLNNELFRSLGPFNHWVAGRWTLLRDHDTLSGYYTLVWRKINGQWVIVSDHSS
jgi:ketosteroid isomerase-like protein